MLVQLRGVKGAAGRNDVLEHASSSKNPPFLWISNKIPNRDAVWLVNFLLIYLDFEKFSIYFMISEDRTWKYT